jgi:hypothetical protein
MNWGYKILVVYGVFVVGIMFLVFKSSNQKMDLVTSDYYGKELKYQQIIDQSKRVSDLTDTIRYEIKGNDLLVHFPKDFAGKSISGTVELYYPADENKDMKQDFSLLDSVFSMSISTANKGLHELHITWKADGKDYYYEKKIII